MKWIFIILLFVFSTQAAVAQEDSSFLLVRTYTGDIVDATMDNLDNLYVISSSGQIKKFNAAGDSVAVYNQVRNFGKLFSIDVSNPLKPLLFYKDFSAVVILDRFLSNRSTLDLRKFGVLQPVAVGLSYDNNIWVFDEYDNKLKKLNEQGAPLLETPDLRTVFSEAISPQKIINDNKLVYLADSLQGVFVFDNYGSFKRRLPLRNWQSIAVSSSQLITTDKESISVYNPATFSETRKKYPAFQPYFHAFTNASKFVRFTASTLEVYQYRF